MCADHPPVLLVIDDEKDWCELLRFRLSKQGFRVIVANNLAEGRKALWAETVDCVLLDVHLKEGQNSVEFLQDLRTPRPEDGETEQRIRRIPVIMTTALDFSRRDEYEPLGISDYMLKPIEARRLITRVIEICSQNP